MRELSIADIPEILTTEIVEIMHKMELSQTNSWKMLYPLLSYDQKKQYRAIKSAINKIIDQKKEFENPIAPDDAFREWWKRFVRVDRSVFDYNIEDEIMTIHSQIDFEEEEIEKVYQGKSLYRIKERRKSLEKEAFTFFWETSSTFSQWHPSKFFAPVSIIASQAIISDGFFSDITTNSNIEYSSMEQFMMFQKAILFLDRDVAKAILKSNDVREIKQLGRIVNKFDQEVWDFNRSTIVYLGNSEKFIQNKQLLEQLLITTGTTLVEASPTDSIWGIGLAASDERARRRDLWCGKNLLGEILTQIRIDLGGCY